MMKDYTIGEKTDAILKIVDKYKPERFTYLIFGSVAAAILLGFAVYGLASQKISVPVAIGFFTMGGVVSYTLVQLLAMFDKTMTYLKEKLQ